MQVARNAIRRSNEVVPPSSAGGDWRDSLSLRRRWRAALFLDKQEVTDRVLHVLRSCPFVDLSKVSATASFKNNLLLDMLENVEVLVVVEEEFAVEISNSEADKISSAAHLIGYIAAHPQAK